MQKMPCLFVREFHAKGFTITEAVTSGCEWVLAGEGVATRKWDGTAVLIQGGRAFARYDAKHGKPAPAGAIPCTPAADPITGHWPHWVEATRPEDKWIRDAIANAGPQADGTYEAIGPTINGNADGRDVRTLMRHGLMQVAALNRSFLGLRILLESLPWEGIVFHHPDGRMCKLRRDDFGLPWPEVSP